MDLNDSIRPLFHKLLSIRSLMQTFPALAFFKSSEFIRYFSGQRLNLSRSTDSATEMVALSLPNYVVYID